MPGASANQPPLTMGIDLGEARVGVAMSDALGLLAHPRETIRRQADKGSAADKPVLARLAELARHDNVRTVVLGLPRNMNGTEGPAAQKAHHFAEGLRGLLPDCTVVLVDERLTTVAAQKALHAGGRNTKQSRGVVDQAAAQIILQSYLDAQALKREAQTSADDF